MTTTEFISEIEGAWDRELSGKQVQLWRRNLQRFEGLGLDALFERVTRECRFFPKFADIWTAVREEGLLKEDERQLRTTAEHSWEPTSCKLCGGEGRLHVWYRIYSHEGKWRRQHTRIFGYSSAAGKTYQPDCDEQPFLFRCSCGAGDVASLPEAWPKWGGERREEVPF